MSTVLDTSKLPFESEVRKATWNHGGRSFGTYYAASRSELRLDLERAQPDVFEMLHNRRTREHLKLDLPPGWDFESSWHSTEWREGAYAIFCFVVPHSLRGFGSRGLPNEAAHLFSAYLQLGEGIAYRNFRNIELGVSLKFLPFLITARDYRFFVFHPTEDRVWAALVACKKVMAEVQQFEYTLPKLLRAAYSVVRLSEVTAFEPATIPVASQIKSEIMLPLNRSSGKRAFARRLSFVYKDLPGSQDALSFSYEMNAMQLERASAV